MPISHAERYRRTISGLMSTLRRLSVWTERIKVWEDAEEQDIAKLCQTINAGIAALQELIVMLAYRLEGVDMPDVESETNDETSS